MTNITYCPSCNSPVEMTDADELTCDFCGVSFDPTDGIESEF